MEVWINGEFKGLEQANVSLLSHSFSRGSAIFEVIDISATAKGPAFFAAEPHIDRLFKSAELTYMQLPVTKEEIISASLETARRNQVRSGVAKLFAYFPGIELTVYPKDQQVQLAIFCIDYDKFGVKRESFTVPVDVGISSYRKFHPETMPLHAKVCGSYVNGYLSMAEALRSGYGDFINCDLNGYVAESAAASAFFIKNGAIKTARPENVLLGITRRVVLELAESIGIPAEEGGIRVDDVKSMDEAFYTSSTKPLQPIRSIDGKKLGDTCPGPVTRRVSEALNRTCAGEYPNSEKWLMYI